MFYPTKPGSEDFEDVSLFIRKVAYSIYHRQEQIERAKMGLEPCPRFKIEPLNLDRFIKRDIHEFSVDGSNPPEQFLSEFDGEEPISQKVLKLFQLENTSALDD